MTDLVLINPWRENMTINNENYQVDSMESKRPLAEKLQAAKDQIGENDKIVKQCLEQLREWIRQNEDIENLFIDDNYLLRFLRTKKFSLFMTQQMILKYLNFRKKFFHYIDSLDFEEEKANALINTGFIFASPIRDNEGRRVIIYNVGKFDMDRFINVDMARALAITYEAVIEDEETQILGVNHVANLEGISIAYTSLFTITEFARAITWGEQSFPMRHKDINLLNVPSAVKYVYEYALSRMSKKLTERFTLHDSITTITERVDKRCLPLEFGGVMPMSEMIQLWKEELGRKRERILGLKNMNLLSDRGIISRKTINEHMTNSNLEGVTGSFRKLEVD
ncbi:hypothetical protein WA026_013181 [Henosepilachna vigintioctopunctata]|uniref:CRAL-TRIO domain-containing protein n=1 Tax=Henosepilachna vigintioctopunctata TaxID=420089 RepID=A0AAW1UB51_9CUCU